MKCFHFENVVTYRSFIIFSAQGDYCMSLELVRTKLKVVVYGIGNTLEQALEYIETRFEILACSDSNIQKRNSDFAIKYPFVYPQEIKKISYDGIIITSIYDTEIKRVLIDKYELPLEKIWTRMEWCHIAVGKECEDRTKCVPYIIGRPIRVKNGLMSYFLATTEQLAEIEGRNFIPIMDMKTYPNQYMDTDELGKVNTWEKFFEPLSKMGIDEALNSKNAIWGYDSPNYLTNYKEDYDIDAMHIAYEKYIYLKPNVQKYIDCEYERILHAYRKPLGVLIRGTDMNQLKLKNHPIQPSMEEMAEIAENYYKEWNCDIIYLSTEDEKIYRYFKATFGEKVVSTNQHRFENTGEKWLAEIEIFREDDKFLRGLEYLTTIFLLSKCDNMIGSLCCGTLCTQIIHGSRYENLVIVEKGFY